MADDECTCPPEGRDEDCLIHGVCSYCGDTGYNWVNAVDCTHCEAGAERSAREPSVVTGGWDPSVAVVEVP